MTDHENGSPRTLTDVDPVEVELLIQRNLDGDFGLFAADSVPGGQFVFSSGRHRSVVTFLGENPLMNVDNRFEIPANRTVPFTIRDDLQLPAKFPFVVQPIGLSGAFGPLELGVDAGPGEEQVGIVLDEEMKIQVIAKQVLQGLAKLNIRNTTGQTVEIEVSMNRGYGWTLHRIPGSPEGGENALLIEIPVAGFGEQARLRFATMELRSRRFQTGGTDQAEILVFPPP